MIVFMILCLVSVGDVLGQNKCPVQIKGSATGFDCDSATALQNMYDDINTKGAAACAKRTCKPGTCYLNHVILIGQPVYTKKKNRKCPDGFLKEFSADFILDCQCR